MWTDVYLKAADEEMLKAALPAAWMGAEGEVLLAGEDYALDMIGTLAGANGWHANVRLADGALLPEALAAFVLPTPLYPKRRFA